MSGGVIVTGDHDKVDRWQWPPPPTSARDGVRERTGGRRRRRHRRQRHRHRRQRQHSSRSRLRARRPARAPRAQSTAAQVRPAPLSGGPPPFEDHLDRRAESEALVRAEGSSPANIYGDAGVGKTYVLAAARSQRQCAPLIGLSTCWKGQAPSRSAAGAVRVVLRMRAALQAERARSRRDLSEREGLVVIDALELEQDEAQALTLAAPRLRFIFGSRERRLWEERQFRSTA